MSFTSPQPNPNMKISISEEIKRSGSGGKSVTCRNCELNCPSVCNCGCHTYSCKDCAARACDHAQCNCECHENLADKNQNSNEKNLRNSGYVNKLTKKNVGSEYMASDDEDAKKKSLFKKFGTTSGKKKAAVRIGSIICAKTSQMEIFMELSNDDIEFANKMEAKVKKEREMQIRNNPGRKQFSKYSSIVLADQISDEEKLKMGLISDFKYKDLITDEDNTGKMTAEQHKNLANLISRRREEKINNIFKWTSKTKEKTDHEEKQLQKDFDIGQEERVPQMEKKTLSNSLQRQFELSRITLPNPDRLENYREERFIRDKSLLAKDAEFLNREIKHEKISDKKKLASSIFADIEKQESWQSYTTLLFADAEVESDNNNAGGPLHKKTN